MGVIEVTGEMLAAKLGGICPHLDERQRRLLMGAEARALGHGGGRRVAGGGGVREATVSLGVDELDAGAGPLGRARRRGGGRKRAADLDRGLRPALLALVEPQERGDPMSPLRWTTMSTRTLAAELTRQGHKVSADTVGDLLRQEGFSLQGNPKTIEGKRHPDRDAQTTRRRGGCGSPGTGAAPTATAPARGRPSSPPWPPRPGWRSRCATSRRAPPSGTRSSTGCSPTSP